MKCIFQLNKNIEKYLKNHLFNTNTHFSGNVSRIFVTNKKCRIDKRIKLVDMLLSYSHNLIGYLLIRFEKHYMILNYLQKALNIYVYLQKSVQNSLSAL